MSESGSATDLGPTSALMALPEEVRVKYCIEVIIALADTAEKIAGIKGKLPQLKAVKEFLAELRTKKDEILPIILFTIKPEFRDTYLELLDTFSGVVGGSL